MTIASIGMGANLGDAAQTLDQAIADIHALPDTSVLAVSSLYRSAPVEASGPDYTNAVIDIHTELDAHALLHHLQAIENSHGRTRPFHHAPRTLDLDILLFGEVEMQTHTLVLPHPRMHKRAFVLRPLAELRPNLVLSQGTIDTLIDQCAGQSIERVTDTRLTVPANGGHGQ